MSQIVRFLMNSKEYFGLITEDDCSSVKLIEGDIYSKWDTSNKIYSLDEVKLLSPCTPTKIVGVGLNYSCVLEHKGEQKPNEPTIFLKPSSSVIGPEESIVIPPGLEAVGYEVELGVVIKKETKDVDKANVSDYIFGYTCANDITASEFMKKGSPWTKGKGFDTFTPLGPSILVDADPSHVFRLKMFLNGNLTQDQTTDKMLFNVSELIEYISSIMTLFPGDVIITGTPSGKGPLKRGDKIFAEIEGLGQLANDVI